ncbi:MAG TPA: hypothetical protein VKT78_14050 [Fimbriimonadaceae bacterium]|nr:hypothetical protein [Fimbriimonadaceae bacterium]
MKKWGVQLVTVAAVGCAAGAAYWWWNEPNREGAQVIASGLVRPAPRRPAVTRQPEVLGTVKGKDGVTRQVVKWWAHDPK